MTQKDTPELKAIYPQPGTVKINGKKYTVRLCMVKDEIAIEDRFESIAGLYLNLREKPAKTLTFVLWQLLDSEGRKDFPTQDIIEETVSKQELFNSGAFNVVLRSLGLSISIKEEPADNGGTFRGAENPGFLASCNALIKSLLRIK